MSFFAFLAFICFCLCFFFRQTCKIQNPAGLDFFSIPEYGWKPKDGQKWPFLSLFQSMDISCPFFKMFFGGGHFCWKYSAIFPPAPLRQAAKTLFQLNWSGWVRSPLAGKMVMTGLMDPPPRSTLRKSRQRTSRCWFVGHRGRLTAWRGTNIGSGWKLKILIWFFGCVTANFWWTGGSTRLFPPFFCSGFFQFPCWPPPRAKAHHRWTLPRPVRRCGRPGCSPPSCSTPTWTRRTPASGSGPPSPSPTWCFFPRFRSVPFSFLPPLWHLKVWLGSVNSVSHCRSWLKVKGLLVWSTMIYLGRSCSVWVDLESYRFM